jgi:hypothetical protein
MPQLQTPGQQTTLTPEQQLALRLSDLKVSIDRQKKALAIFDQTIDGQNLIFASLGKLEQDCITFGKLIQETGFIIHEPKFKNGDAYEPTRDANGGVLFERRVKDIKIYSISNQAGQFLTNEDYDLEIMSNVVN